MRLDSSHFGSNSNPGDRWYVWKTNENENGAEESS